MRTPLNRTLWIVFTITSVAILWRGFSSSRFASQRGLATKPLKPSWLSAESVLLDTWPLASVGPTSLVLTVRAEPTTYMGDLDFMEWDQLRSGPPILLTLESLTRPAAPPLFAATLQPQMLAETPSRFTLSLEKAAPDEMALLICSDRSHLGRCNTKTTVGVGKVYFLATQKKTYPDLIYFYQYLASTGRELIFEAGPGLARLERPQLDSVRKRYLDDALGRPALGFVNRNGMAHAIGSFPLVKQPHSLVVALPYSHVAEKWKHFSHTHHARKS